MVALMRPEYGKPLLSTPQKELILKVMNDLAIRGATTDIAMAELESEVHMHSNAIDALDNISRRLDFLVNEDDVTSGNRTIQRSVEEIQRLIVRLDDTIHHEADYSGHVNDLLLLLRGVLLIKEIHVEKRLFQRTVFSAVNPPETLQDWDESTKQYLDELDEKVRAYTQDVFNHKYTMDFVSTYVEMCTDVLPSKLDALEQAHNACRQRLQERLEQLQEEHRSKRARVGGGGEDAGALGQSFIAKLRL